MDIRAEIAARLEKLSPDLQERVLRFVSSLGSAASKGQHGATLIQFAGSFSHDSAREVVQAIEEGCERVDALDW